LSCQLDKSSDRRGLYTARATGSYESRSLVYLSAALFFFVKVSRTCHVPGDLSFLSKFPEPATFLGTCLFYQSFHNLPRSWNL
jgi:hypothetical protein